MACRAIERMRLGRIDPQTTANAVHTGEHRVVRGHDMRSRQLGARTDRRAHQTSNAASRTGNEVLDTAHDTGATVVHGAQTTGNAVHSAEHNVRR